MPALIFAIIFFFAVKDRPDQVSWLSQEEKDYLIENYEKEKEAMHKVKRYSVRKAFTDPKVLKLCLIYFLWVVGFWGFYFWMPTVLKELSGLSTSLLGGAIAIPMMAALVVQLIISKTATLTGDKVWHVAGALTVGAVGLALSPFASNLVLALVLVCMSAIGIHAAMGVWWTIPTTFLTGPAAAGSIALINSCGNVGGWVGPNMMAWIKVNTGSFDVGYYIMGGAMLLAAILVLTIQYGFTGKKAK